MEKDKSVFTPDRANYIKSVDIAKDIANLTGVDKQAINSILKGVSLLLAHYIVEEAKNSDDLLQEAVLEIPYIGTLSVEFDSDRPITKSLGCSFEFTKTFRDYLIMAFKEGKSPLEDAVIKKFVDVFIDKYRSAI